MNADHQQTIDAAAEVIEDFVVANIESLENKFNVLALVFFSKVESGNIGTDLNVWEFLEYQVKPVKNELDSWLDW